MAIIYGNHQSSVLDHLRNSSYDFHLTGSRYFEFTLGESDWDFITEDSLEIRQFLLGLGFEPIGKSYGEICNHLVNEVLRKKEDSHSQFDIQLCGNIGMQKRLIVQEVIKTYMPLFNTLSKNVRRQIWGIALGASNHKFNDDYFDLLARIIFERSSERIFF